MQRALVVDDSKAVRMIISKTLRDLGFEVFEASNGAEALRLLLEDKTRVQLVIADWNMPKMSGMDLLKHLRQDEEFSSLVFFMVTTETELPRIQAALNAGANEYIMKPFTTDILIHKLQLAGIQPRGAKTCLS